MKTKVQYFSILLTLIVSIVLLRACKKDCDPNNPPEGITQDMSPSEKLVFFPYKDSDTIKFVKNNVDTVYFYGGKFETGYNTGYDQDPNCPHMDKLQFYKQVFTNNLYGTITLYEYLVAMSTEPYYSITFNRTEFLTKSAWGISSYRDTTKFIIQGKPYSDVYKFNSNSASNNLYYVRKIGIVKIIANDMYEKTP